jgi:hypothetical protein
MIVMRFTIELDIPRSPSFLLLSALPRAKTDRETKLIGMGGPSDRTAIAGAAFEIPEAEPAPAHSSP